MLSTYKLIDYLGSFTIAYNCLHLKMYFAVCEKLLGRFYYFFLKNQITLSLWLIENYQYLRLINSFGHHSFPRNNLIWLGVYCGNFHDL